MYIPGTAGFAQALILALREKVSGAFWLTAAAHRRHAGDEVAAQGALQSEAGVRETGFVLDAIGWTSEQPH